MGDVCLDEFDKNEWWDILCAAIRLKGGTPPTRDDFEKDWDEFQEMKRRMAMQ